MSIYVRRLRASLRAPRGCGDCGKCRSEPPKRMLLDLIYPSARLLDCSECRQMLTLLQANLAVSNASQLQMRHAARPSTDGRVSVPRRCGELRKCSCLEAQRPTPSTNCSHSSVPGQSRSDAH